MRRAQSTLEYVLIVAAVIGGIMAMQLYVKRSVQGRLKDLADEISQQAYNPGRDTISSFAATKTYSTVEEISGNTATTYMGAAPLGETAQGTAEVSTRSGYERSTER